MAKRALDSQGGESFLLIKEARHPHYCVELEQSKCRGRRVKVYSPRCQLLLQRNWQRIDIHFESHCQGGARAHPGTDATQIRPGNSLVQLESIAPECLVSEGVISEYLPSDCHFS